MSLTEGAKTTVLGAVASILLGLGLWVFTLNARMAVQEEKQRRSEMDRKEVKQVIRENTKAIYELKDYLMRKKD